MIWLMTSLGFPFASHARHGIEEASDNGHRKKKKRGGGDKHLISLAKWKKKDNPRRQVLLGHCSSAPTYHIEKKL